MSASSNLEYVKSYMHHITGIPVLPEVLMEVNAVTVALRLALRRYWTVCPYLYLKSHRLSQNASNIVENIDSLKQEAFPSEQMRSIAYYIGPVRMSEGEMVYNMFDSWLLNLPRGVGLRLSLGGRGTRMFNYAMSNLDSLSVDTTFADLVFGETEYEVDTVNNVVRILVPPNIVQLTIWHGFGIEDMTLGVVPQKHLELFAKIASYYYLSTIISARSSAQIQSDISLNVEFLEQRLEAIENELKETLPSYAIQPILWT